MLFSGNFNSGGGSLLSQPAYNGVFGSTSVVFSGNSVNEEFKGGVSRDSESGSEIFVNSGINLGQRNRIFQDYGSLSVFRGKTLAVSTPGGVEFNQDILIGANNTIEVIHTEDQNSIFFWYVSSHTGANKGDDQ